MADSDNIWKRDDVQILSHDSNALSRRQDGRGGGGRLGMIDRTGEDQIEYIF